MSADFLQSHIGRRHPDYLSSKTKCVGVCVCVCIRTCIHVCMYMCACVCSCVCTWVHACMCVRVRACMCCAMCTSVCTFLPSTNSSQSATAASGCSGHVSPTAIISDNCSTTCSIRLVDSMQHPPPLPPPPLATVLQCPLKRSSHESSVRWRRG